MEPQEKKRIQASSSGDVMTAKEVAEYLKICERTVTNLAIKKKIPGTQIGSLWRFSRATIESLV